MTFFKRRHVLAGMLSPLLAQATDGPAISPVGPPLELDLAGGELDAFMPSADGRQVLVDTESALLVVDAARGTALRPPLKAHRDPSALAQPLADGLRLVQAGWGEGSNARPAGKLTLLDAATKQSQPLAALAREPRQLVASANGQRFAVADAEEKLQVFDAAGRTLMGPMKPVPGQVVAGTRLDRITALALSPDGARLAVAGEDVQTRLFDVASGKPVLTLDKGPFQGRSWVRGPSSLMAFTPDGRQLLALEQGGNLSLYDVASGRPLADPVPLRSRAVALAFGPDGRLWTATAEGQLQRWQIKLR